MHVRVSKRRREPAGLAAAAGGSVFARCRAYERLRDPDRDALLSYASSSVKEKTGRQSAALDRGREARFERVMTIERYDRHAAENGRLVGSGPVACGMNPENRRDIVLRQVVVILRRQAKDL